MNDAHIQFEALQRAAGGKSLMELEFGQEGELHLQHCAECQRRLDEYAAGATWWKKASDYLCMDEMDEEADSLTQQFESQVGRGVEQSALDELTHQSILEGAAHPEMLGRIAHYDIEKVIGRGGMGIVYKGYDRELNRSVAIKVLSPHLASNGTARKRFSREARAAAAVVHPNVIPIHGVNSQNKLPYIVMPLIGGRSLQELVDREGPLDVKDTIRVAMQIAAGLEAAHKQGLVHRDIKPANILIEDDVSRVVITDFGLARAADDAAMTHTGWLAGTPHYMSPEQARGRSVDYASDLFSLGSLMYFMATGRVPFRADGPVAVLNLICTEQVVPIRQINADIPKRLAEIIDKLLEKQAGDRFRSAAQVHNLLEAYLAYLQHPDFAPPPRPVRTRRQIGRRASYLAVAASVLLVATIGYGWFATHEAPTSVTTDPAVNAPGLVESAADSSEEIGAGSFVGEESFEQLNDLNLMPQEEFDSQINQLEQEIRRLDKELRAQPFFGDWSDGGAANNHAGYRLIEIEEEGLDQVDQEILRHRRNHPSADDEESGESSANG